MKDIMEVVTKGGAEGCDKFVDYCFTFYRMGGEGDVRSFIENFFHRMPKEDQIELMSRFTFRAIDLSERWVKGENPFKEESPD